MAETFYNLTASMPNCCRQHIRIAMLCHQILW